MLAIQVEDKKCKKSKIIMTPGSGSEISVPISGKSIPITIDFSECLPVSEVTVVGSVDNFDFDL